MKVRNKVKAERNGAASTRQEMLQRHGRFLKLQSKMSAREGFRSLLRAGIITKDGKLAGQYGG